MGATTGASLIDTLASAIARIASMLTKVNTSIALGSRRPTKLVMSRCLVDLEEEFEKLRRIRASIERAQRANKSASDHYELARKAEDARNQEIFTLVREGLTRQRIADELDLTPQRVTQIAQRTARHNETKNKQE